jgi:ATP-binding protein involved in chromosome partitioning
MIPVEALPNLKVMSMSFFLPDADTPIIWRGPMKMGAIKQFLSEVQWGDLDYLIIDLPPGTGDEPLSIAQLIPDSDGAVIVTTPQDLAMISVRKSVNFVRKMNIPIIGIIENMSGFTCPHCNATIDIFKTGGGYKMSLDFMIPFLGTIPLDPVIVEQSDTGKTSRYHATSPSNTSFQTIVKNMEKIIKNKR